MFSRISAAIVYALVAFSILAAAKPWATVTVTDTAPATTATTPASQCNTGPVQCCNSVQSGTSPAVSTVLALLGIDLTDLNVPVGLTCTPISVVGVGSGATCAQQPVCCENNDFNGLINIGCSPVNLGL